MRSSFVDRPPRSRGRIYESMAELVGATPLLRLQKFATAHAFPGVLLGKLEFLSPSSSLKDRAALAMIEAAERSGQLKPGGIIIEPTAGNTAISLAYLCARRGYRLVLPVPESVSLDRRRFLAHFGAEVILTPASLRANGAFARAEELAKIVPGAIMLRQFHNPVGAQVHLFTTGMEIWEDTQGEVDAVVAALGTGGTLAGTGEFLKARKPSVRLIVAEPEASEARSQEQAGWETGAREGDAGFQSSLVSEGLLDEVVPVSLDMAFTMARSVARLEGVPAGISSGAVLAAAVELGRRPEWVGRTVVGVLASGAERYLSSPLFHEPASRTS